MGATWRPESVNTWRTPSALSMRTRSCAPVEVAMTGTRFTANLPIRGHHTSRCVWCPRNSNSMKASASALRELAEARERGRKLGQRRNGRAGMKPPGALVQHGFVFRDVRIRNAAVDRTHRRARFLLVKADALGAQLRVDDEDVLALTDGLVRTLRFAGAAVDALHGDHRRHGRVDCTRNDAPCAR